MRTIWTIVLRGQEYFGFSQCSTVLATDNYYKFDEDENPPFGGFIQSLLSPNWLEAHTQVPSHQPVRLLLGQQRGHPVGH